MAANSTDRPAANFSPSLWGDIFIKHTSHAQASGKCYKDEFEDLKNEVRSMLCYPGSKMVDTIDLINTLERLGVSYHFENEIEDKLSQYFNLNTKYDEAAYDLYTVSLHFRLFRQHGYRISCDIFGKWINENGKFDEGVKRDAKGLLSLYEACYLRTHGDTILDDALDFATANLKSMLPNLIGSPLGKQVERALAQPLHLGTTRVDERYFVSMYEEFEHKNETLLRFSKLDFNQVQKLHKKELEEVSRWWKDLDFYSRPPYARDRAVECFFWAMGVYHEPHFSRARVMLTKTICMISVADDIYDAYGNIQELNVLTEAMERWDTAEIDSLPDYIMPFYKATAELYQQFDEELSKEGRSYATKYAIEALKELIKCYHVEATWFIEGTLPSFEEYLNISLITCTYCYLATTSLIGMESVTKEDFEWLSKKPKILVASLKICRYIDDIGTYEVEKERGQIATGIECYMKENGVTKEDAVAKFYEFADNAWKDMNEECLRPIVPSSRQVLMRILNLGRLLDVTYKNGDGYTHPEKGLKPHIIALFVDPIKIN